jgi:hypothetical protein
MNMENKNMDKVFREKLDGFSQQPPSHVWENIREQLGAQKRKKRIVLYRRIAAAAVVVLAFLAGWYFNSQTKNVVPQTVKVEKSGTEINIHSPANIAETDETVTNNESASSLPLQIAVVSPSEKQEAEAVIKSDEPQYFEEKLKPMERIILTLLESRKAKIGVQNEINISMNEITVDEITHADRVLIAENLEAMKTSATEYSKWKMGVHISPGYSSQSVNYSETYANNMAYSANEGNTNITGGFSVQYKSGKKLSVETGIYYDQNGRSSVTPGSIFSKRFEYADNPHYDASGYYLNYAVNSANGALEMNSQAGVIEFSGLPAGSEIVANFDGTTNSGSNILLADGEYTQVFEFVEFPLYLRYSVLDSKFGFEIMGGVNTVIVADNNVYFERSGTARNIGKTKDISRVNFSGTVGLGVNYALGKNFSLSVEPRFNYYLNSINQNPDVNFRPYRIGVYTGLYYEF